MIQSIGRVRREYSSAVLRFKIKYDPRTNIGEVYYVTGEPHAVFKQCKLSDKDIIITYHDKKLVSAIVILLVVLMVVSTLAAALM